MKFYAWQNALAHGSRYTTMATRLRVKYKKKRKDTATAYKAEPGRWGHKIATERSVKAKKKNANRMA